MSSRSAPVELPSAKTIATGLVWLSLFSLLYTAGDEIGAWPKLPPGAFQNFDLVVGICAGLALLAALLRPRPEIHH